MLDHCCLSNLLFLKNFDLTINTFRLQNLTREDDFVRKDSIVIQIDIEIDPLTTCPMVDIDPFVPLVSYLITQSLHGTHYLVALASESACEGKRRSTNSMSSAGEFKKVRKQSLIARRSDP